MQDALIKEEDIQPEKRDDWAEMQNSQVETTLKIQTRVIYHYIYTCHSKESKTYLRSK